MDRMHGRGATKALAVSTMVFALVTAAACGKKADDTKAAETTKAAAAAPALPAATVIDAVQLEKGAAALKGQKVRVNAATVVSKLGEKAFWFALPNKNPFLVMTSDGAAVSPQDVLDVVGTVTIMNDSILKAWLSSGAINDNQKLEAEFATEFIQAEAMQKAGGAPDNAMPQPPTGK